jgi:hypothetical protein
VVEPEIGVFNTNGEKLPFLKAPFFSRQHGDRPDPTEEA